MTTEALIKILMSIPRGQVFRIVTNRQLTPAALFKGKIDIRKESISFVRVGVNRDNIATIKQARAEGLIPQAEDSSLPDGWTWKHFPYVLLSPKGEEQFRFYPSPLDNHKSTVQYYLNGVGVNKEDLRPYMTPSFFKDYSKELANGEKVRDCFNAKAETIKEILL